MWSLCSSKSAVTFGTNVQISSTLACVLSWGSQSVRRESLVTCSTETREELTCGWKRRVYLSSCGNRSLWKASACSQSSLNMWYSR
jgi:hypothetical protein